MSHTYTEAERRLFQAILTLRTEDECLRFFDDLCTIKELQDLSQRLEVAEMLADGKNYQEVSRATGASTATISRVNKCLNYGNRGYQTAFSRMKENEDSQS